MSLQQVLQRLYGEERNCRLECFWDGGWELTLGDEMNGWGKVFRAYDLDELAAHVARHFGWQK